MGAPVTSQRIFISHAASDKPLASLFERILIYSGVPRERLFYSSDRATGVPAGRGSREVLKEMLRDDPFVMEVITETFMTRPMCLMELGAAWVSEVPTFPVVVPPLSREDVVSRIGDVHLPQLGTESEVDELFDELQDRIRQHLGVPVRAAVWNPAVKDFKRDLPQALTAIARPVAGTGSGGRAQAAAADGQRLSADLMAHNFSWLDGTYGTEVLGELTNDSTRDLQMVILSATFYGAAGAIVGTANGSVNGLPGGQTKTFRLSSVGHVNGIASMRLQTDGQM